MKVEHMTPAQMKIAAIRARLAGALGQPALLAILPVTDALQSDIWTILDADVSQDMADVVQAIIDAADT